MQDTKETSSRRQNALLRLANVVVKIVGIAIFLVLVRLSLCYTQNMMPGEIERMVTVRDSVPQNLAFLAIWILIGVFLILLEKKLGETARKRLSVIALIAAMLVVAVQSFWWIFSAVRVPVIRHLSMAAHPIFRRAAMSFWIGEAITICILISSG